MKAEKSKEKLKAAFLRKAEAVFEAALEKGEGGEMRLSEMEERVAELKFELTSLLVESMIEVQDKGKEGPGPKCGKCGQEMYTKGKKRRRVLTSQGEIELERTYHYCQQCREGIFPPGSTIGGQPTRLE